VIIFKIKYNISITIFCITFAYIEIRITERERIGVIVK